MDPDPDADACRSVCLPLKPGRKVANTADRGKFKKMKGYGEKYGVYSAIEYSGDTAPDDIVKSVSSHVSGKCNLQRQDKTFGILRNKEWVLWHYWIASNVYNGCRNKLS